MNSNPNCTKEFYGYNLNVDEAIVFKDPFKRPRNRGSYFGYSVALYSDEFYQNPAVIVGAPRANVSAMHVKEPGSVFKCTFDGRCREWIVDDSTNTGLSGMYGSQIRDFSWLGATISVENHIHPRVVVCAPRWKIKLSTEVYLNGMCYYSIIGTPDAFNRTHNVRIKSMTDYYLQTSRAKNGQVYYHYGMGQLGMSVHEFHNDGSWNIMLGSPGAFSWYGTPVLVTESRPGVFRSVVPTYDITNYEYLGYSVTSGHYFGLSRRYFAAGAPRNDDMKGRVLVFSYDVDKKKLIIKNILTGTQHGEYFGSAITSCDVDGDGDDELIVGAPLWSQNGDEGRIYIFHNRYYIYMELSFSIDGTVENGRFGSSVMCLGDIDKDGYQDIAVGAPYENDHGAVFIFNGQQKGLSTTWSQKITGNQFSETLNGFGISISEPRDVDGNGYPDFAVGAFKSSHAVLLRSHSVINLNIDVDLDDNFKLETDSSSFFIKVCCFYDGIRAPDSIRIIKQLTIDPMERRAYLQTIRKINGMYHAFDQLSYGKTRCERFKILLQENLINVFDPIEIKASIILDTPEIGNQNAESRDNFCHNCPVINKLRSKTEDIIKLPFAVDCGPDDVCRSNITLDVTTNLKGNRYIIGTRQAINVSINVNNYGEGAYHAYLNVFLPIFLTLASVPLNCDEHTKNNGELIVCSIGNPLKDNQTVLLEIDVMVNSDQKQTNLEISVDTQSENINYDNSQVNLTIFFDVDVDIAVAGKAQEDLYSYFNDTENALDTMRFDHIYEVRKFGATSIEQAILKVLIPTHLIDSDNTIDIATINRTELSLPKTMINRHNSFCSNGTIEDHTEFKYDDNYSVEKINIKDNIVNVLTNDRTFYVNCSNPLIICTTIYCVLQTSLNLSTVAEIKFTMDLKIKNLKENILEEKDIVYFVSSGHVNISLPKGIVQINNNNSDHLAIGTMFVGSPTAKPVAVWIIAFSVVLGIILLIILIIVLVKIGFFNRRKKEELEALKADVNRQDQGLEMNSSTEVLDTY
ncbi:integrin alpha-9 isoform X2 [Cotesia typhae]|uniref:integrin alpha-9 isoform X2 n=1 Tax=Cotesia typhae TaxID=2053667 RepID=UPI003D68E1BD